MKKPTTLIMNNLFIIIEINIILQIIRMMIYYFRKYPSTSDTASRFLNYSNECAL